jgi:hypothetical protein
MVRYALSVTLSIGLMLAFHSAGANARTHRIHAQHSRRVAHVYNDSNYAAHDYSGRGSKPKSFVPRPRAKPAVPQDY